tara:strand:+ start:574 stop:1080 length:507 start_codon:yes stop_codon:yes gene_type:complete
MAIVNRKTGEVTYSGQVYDVKGATRLDYFVDLVTVIDDLGNAKELTIAGNQFEVSKDVTAERMKIHRERMFQLSRIAEFAQLREMVKQSKETGLTARQFIELIKGLNLEDYQTPNLSNLLKKFEAKKLRSNFKISLITQAIKWAKGEREFERPLSRAQINYFQGFLED